MVISTVNQVVYNGDGINTAWPYTFRIIDATDIKLTIVDADGAETPITADYYVDTINNTVYYPGYAPGAEPPAEDQPPKLQEGQKIIVYRQLPVNQLANLGEKWPFNVIEKGLDKLTMLIQDVWGWVSNKVINRVGDAWDALGLPIHNVGGPVNVADAATKDYVDRILNGLVIAGDSRTVPFDNVAQMIAAEIEAGQIAFTLGYHDINDGGVGVYNIRAKVPGDVDDGGSIIFLNGNVAELIHDGVINIKQFGAKGNANYLNTSDHKWYVDSGFTTLADDDADIIQLCCSKFKNVVLPRGNYLLGSTLVLNGVNVYGYDASIKIANHSDFSYTSGTHKNVIRIFDDVNICGISFYEVYTNNSERFPNVSIAQRGVVFLGSGSTINKCKFYNFTSNTLLVYGEGVHNVLIESCYIDDCGVGIQTETQADDTGADYAVTVRNCYVNANANGSGIGNALFEGCTFDQKNTSSPNYSNFQAGINDANVDCGSVTTCINCRFRAFNSGIYNVIVYGFNQAVGSTHMFRGHAEFIGCTFEGTQSFGVRCSGNANFNSCTFLQNVVPEKTTKNGVIGEVHLNFTNCEYIGHPTDNGLEYLISVLTTDVPIHISMINCYTNHYADNNRRLFNLSDTYAAGGDKVFLTLINCVSGTNYLVNIKTPVIMFGCRKYDGTESFTNMSGKQLIMYRCITDYNFSSYAAQTAWLSDSDFLANAHGVYYFDDNTLKFVGNSRYKTITTS